MIIVGVVLIAIAAFVYAYGPQPPAIFLGAIGFFILVSGYKLTVEIKDCVLKFWFGPGIFWKNIPLERIAYCRLYDGIIFGWGIHIGPGGWLYNVSGMKAVMVVLKSGKKMFIGTDEPQQLIEAVNSAIHGFGSNEDSLMWAEVKTDYLKRVEQALSAARHPRSFEILADVSNHLDSRFAELGPQNRNWENFQKITTEMGPPSEYAELIGQQPVSDKVILSAGYAIALVLILAAVGVGMIILPKVLKPGKASPAQQAFVNAPELVGKWVSVDFVKEANEFKPSQRQWRGDLFLKDIEFNPDGTTTLGWTWTKGWITDRESGVKAEYEIRDINGTAYLFLPWLSGDVTIRHRKPEYYILKRASETGSQPRIKDEQTTEAAIEAAKGWLKLVDDGQYSQSWSQAAEYFRKNVSEEQWSKAIEPVRKPLGKVLSRKVINSTYTTLLPGAPDGQYVVIQFETSFENKHNAVETVTPMMEPDGQWRVSGYYIR
jgi:hypothetical protein